QGRPGGAARHPMDELKRATGSGAADQAAALDKAGARKTRALKKYEAAPIAGGHAAGHHPGEPDLALFSPFGPLIATAVLPLALTDEINRYGDQVVGDRPGKEFLVPKEVALDGAEQSLMRHTEALIRRYLALIDEPATAPVTIDVFWIVSQGPSTPSPVHFHS